MHASDQPPHRIRVERATCEPPREVSGEAVPIVADSSAHELVWVQLWSMSGSDKTINVFELQRTMPLKSPFAVPVPGRVYLLSETRILVQKITCD